MSTLYIVYNLKSGFADSDVDISQQIAVLSRDHIVHRWTIAEILDAQQVAKRIIEDAPDYLIAIGGDGTVNATASVAATHQLRLLVVPNGTFNHFAKHLLLPSDVPTALHLLKRGRTILVDTGLVNDQLFVNFISMGAYAELIVNRIRHQKAGSSKWVSFVKAVFNTVSKKNMLTLRFSVNDTVIEKQTSLLFVGNGIFEFGSLDILSNRILDQTGKLQLAATETKRPADLIWFMFKSMFTDSLATSDLKNVAITDCAISLPRRSTTKVIVDGEHIKMTFPLRISVARRSLRLVVPIDHSLPT